MIIDQPLNDTAFKKLPLKKYCHYILEVEEEAFGRRLREQILEELQSDDIFDS